MNNEANIERTEIGSVLNVGAEDFPITFGSIIIKTRLDEFDDDAKTDTALEFIISRRYLYWVYHSTSSPSSINTESENEIYITDRKDLCRVINGSESMPYKLYSHTDQSINEMMNKLRKFSNNGFRNRIDSKIIPKINNIKLEKNTTIIPVINYLKDHTDFNILSDMFLEDIRMRCNVKSFESPYDYWKNNKQSLVEACFDKYGVYSDALMIEYLWSNKLIHECTSFRPTVMITVVSYLMQHKKSISILDPSSGWGDRLIAAMSMKLVNEYVGIDPNLEVHGAYQSMINRLSKPENKKKYKMLGIPFQDFKTTRKFDVIFTSPPYFDYEKYSDLETQSIVQFPTEKKWTDGFFLPYLNKAWWHTKSGGYMIININQGKHQRYVDAMLSFMKEKVDFKRVIVFGYGYKQKIVKHAQPVFAFKKK